MVDLNLPLPGQAPNWGSQLNQEISKIGQALGRTASLVFWDGSSYPPRTPDTSNIFVGPVDPGIGMDPNVDVWANSNSTTLDTVVSAVQDTGSALYSAIKGVTDESVFINPSMFFKGASTDQTAGPSGLGAVPYWPLDPGEQDRIASEVYIPRGWNSVRARLYWMTTDGTTSGSFRVEVGITPIDNSTGLDSLSSNLKYATLTVPNTAWAPRASYIPDQTTPWTTNPQGSTVRVSVRRRGDQATDTYSGILGIRGLLLERLT